MCGAGLPLGQKDYDPEGIQPDLIQKMEFWKPNPRFNTLQALEEEVAVWW